MAARVSDTLRDMEWVAAPIDARAPKPNRPETCRKRRISRRDTAECRGEFTPGPRARTIGGRIGETAMFTVDKTVSVNADLGPGDRVLDRAALWRGLEMKGENALPFVPVMERCEVEERGENWLVRSIRIGGRAMRERVEFEPETRVAFERLDGIEKGTILNEILEGENGELLLRFTFTLSRDDMEHGSAEEAAYAAGMEDTYLKAVQSTVDTVRRLVGEGAIAAG